MLNHAALYTTLDAAFAKTRVVGEMSFSRNWLAREIMRGLSLPVKLEKVGGNQWDWFFQNNGDQIWNGWVRDVEQLGQ